MKSKIFVVYDSKAEAYNTPFFFQSRGMALRAFQDTIQDPSTMFAKHPSDFTLFEIGDYDGGTAEMSLYTAKVNLGTAQELSRRIEAPKNLHLAEQQAGAQ